ncbi:MAG: PatB family C-S lyase [Rikenellaceae bacterium]|nr:PatB family C-S lyase [Rikenellaceae bacterium]
MRYDFDEPIDRRGSNCEKHDNIANVFGRNDIIPLWVADTDFRTPGFIMDAIRERAAHPVLGYSFRCSYYNDAIRSWLWRRNGWEVKSEWLDFSPGVICGISYGISILSRPGDGVLIQPPVYPPFAQVAEALGRRVITNPLKLVGDSWCIDFDDLDKKLSEVKVFILCNPHNPTGRVFTVEELTKIGELCLKHGVYIVSDEIHSDLTIKGHKHIHIASLSEELARITCTFVAPSKTFNTAGLSTAVAVIPDDKIHRAYTEHGVRNHVGQGNIFGAVALRAAYNNGDEWLDTLRRYIEGNVDYVRKTLSEQMPRIKCTEPEATFLLWLDCRELDLTHEALVDFFINEARLGLNSGLDYGTQGELYMRMNVGCPRATLEKALGQLKKAYDNRNF